MEIVQACGEAEDPAAGTPSRAPFPVAPSPPPLPSHGNRHVAADINFVTREISSTPFCFYPGKYYNVICLAGLSPSDSVPANPGEGITADQSRPRVTSISRRESDTSHPRGARVQSTGSSRREGDLAGNFSSFHSFQFLPGKAAKIA